MLSVTYESDLVTDTYIHIISANPYLDTMRQIQYFVFNIDVIVLSKIEELVLFKFSKFLEHLIKYLV